VSKLLLAVFIAGALAAAEPPAHSDAQAHAAAAAKHGEGHAEAPMPNEIWWKWANFAILAAGLGWLIGKNAGPFFRSRTEEIQAGIREASAAREEAEARAAAIEKRVANLSAEVETLRQKSREEIAREGERVRAETETHMAKIQAQAEAEIASAAKHATQELKAHAAQLALGMAERQIVSRMNPQSQDELTAAFTKELERLAVTN
jgi:F-type H+-transporting ATPase subunit b